MLSFNRLTDSALYYSDQRRSKQQQQNKQCPAISLGEDDANEGYEYFRELAVRRLRSNDFNLYASMVTGRMQRLLGLEPRRLQ